MSKDSKPGQSTGLSRREVLGAVAVLPVGLAPSASAVTESMSDMRMDAHSGHTTELEALETLNAIEMAALEAFCARLIPTDENGPGATEARAAHYIDRALAGPLMNQRAAYAAGLSALDAYARSAKGQPFVELPSAEQDAVLHVLEEGSATGFTPGSAAFFGLVRNHTIEGMFCDPYYGGNANFVGWDLIGYPGLRMMVRPEDQRFTKPAALRESAYSVGMFGRKRG
jgi:gluconate 2-dehydrogenase gamma chain